jgi:hypothetical protein
MAEAIVGVPVQFVMQFKGLQLTMVSHASLIVGTLPVLIALSSSLFLHERLSKSEWLVLLLSPVGVLAIAFSAGHSSEAAQDDFGAGIVDLQGSADLDGEAGEAPDIANVFRVVREDDYRKQTGHLVFTSDAAMISSADVPQQNCYGQDRAGSGDHLREGQRP